MSTETETERTVFEGWHLLPATNKLRYGDGREVQPGVTLSVDPDGLEVCRHGLHASERILDALSFAPANDFRLCRVRLSGKVISDISGTRVRKFCASERKVLWWLTADDTERLLRHLGDGALVEVIPLWDAPEEVKEYVVNPSESARQRAHKAILATLATLPAKRPGAEVELSARVASRWATSDRVHEVGDAVRFAAQAMGAHTDTPYEEVLEGYEGLLVNAARALYDRFPGRQGE